MTNYGAIPTSSHGSPVMDPDSISRAKQRIKDGLAMSRPWRQMFDLHSMNLPHGVSDALSRIKKNLSYFQTNYAIVVLVVIFLSLIKHPTSLIVLTVLVFVWIFLYFFRDEPIKVFRYQIDDHTVLVCLSVITILLLFLTDVTLNLVGALVTGAVLVLIHAVVRKTEDLFLDEEAATAETIQG
ncbi:PRA1 family protein F3 [Raphanus sativus]|uniref:PRA1 family protein n=1 Tax=Raphanus sativus TaxID=3726 RepID=A0A6J0JGB0_RAPSA|nr:PRA1 family protein F3 [Raphanus sativus]XP_056854046.1 PRA1 family protein F3-like [Raphanus sativus]KAJ4870614.1 PRA1 family protein F3 [Raphanus sativus]KAJ4886521.1 PRA1 family protein F3 [Raphanus sativus]